MKKNVLLSVILFFLFILGMVSVVGVVQPTTNLNITRAYNLNSVRLNHSIINDSVGGANSFVVNVNVNTSHINGTSNITVWFNHSNGSLTLVVAFNNSNNVKNYTFGNGTNNATYNTTYNTTLNLVEGIYSVVVNLTNNSGDIFESDSYNVTVDNSAPVVVLNITRGNGSFQNASLDLNWTFTDVSMNATCTLVVDGPGNTSNNSQTGIFAGNGTLTVWNGSTAAQGHGVNFSRGGIVEGNHNYTVNCSDETNHNGTSGYTYFYISYTPPLVEMFAPTNLSSRERYVNATFNVTWRAIDNVSPYMNCSVVLNHSSAQPFHNISVVSINNTNYSRQLTLGDNVTFNISVNCSTGTIINNVSIINSTANAWTTNRSNENFTTNANAPLVTLVSPSDATTNTSSDLTFVCNASDSRLANVTLFHNIDDNGITFVLNQTNASNGTVRTDNRFTYAMASLKTGFTLIWNCNATDTGGNTVFASTNFTIGRPKDISSGGSGGSGGGGSSRGSQLAQQAGVSLPSTGESEALLLYNKMSKSVTLSDGTTQGTVSLVKSYNNEKAVISISGTQYEVAEGQSVAADINGDGVADIEVTVQDAMVTKARLTVRALTSPASVGVFGSPRGDTAESGALGGEEAFVEAADRTLGEKEDESTAQSNSAKESDELAAVTGGAVKEASGSGKGVWTALALVALLFVVVASYKRFSPSKRVR